MRKPFVMDPREFPQGAIDFSHMQDAPAGKHGFVQAREGHLYFEDGARCKFFGLDICMGGCMPYRETAPIYAERLARSGVNILRMHFADSRNRGADGSLIDYSQGNSRNLNPVTLERFDFFVSELKRRGIYVHIDLHVGRHFFPEGDGLDFDDPIEDEQWPLKHIQLFSRRMVELQKEYAHKLLTHVNPYTGLAYKDEPAVAVVQMVNEISTLWVTEHHNAPSYDRHIDTMWNSWLLDKYGSREALSDAWTNEYGERALQDDEDPAAGSVRRPPLGEWMEEVTRYWDDYTALSSPARFSDNVAFLTGKQIAFVEDMYKYLRELGVKAPINFSNHPKGMADVYTNTFGDVMENNAYWNHPERSVPGDKNAPMMFHFKELHSSDPRQVHGPIFECNVLSRLALAPSQDKPFIATEWNALFTTPFNADAMLMMACYGALQDWDGILLHAYAHDADIATLEPGLTRFFDMYAEPATFGQIGVAASIFRGGAVKKAQRKVDIGFTGQDIQKLPESWLLPYGFLTFVSRVQERFLGEDGVYRGDADAVVSSGFTPTGDYRGAPHAVVYSRSPYIDGAHKKRGKPQFLNPYIEYNNRTPLLTNAGYQAPRAVGAVAGRHAVISDELPIDKMYKTYSELLDQCMKHWKLWDAKVGLRQPGCIVSDTGELVYNFAEGHFRAEAPGLLIFAGDIRRGEPVCLGNFRFDIANRKMALSLYPLDGAEIVRSRRLLLTAVGESGNSDMVWDDNMLLDIGHAPVTVDQLDGSLTVLGKSGTEVYALDSKGARAEKLRTEQIGGDTRVELSFESGSIYFEIIFS